MPWYTRIIAAVVVAVASFAGAAEPDTANFEDPSDPVAGKNHWAFRPLERRQPHASTNGVNWSKTAIDQFVVAQLEQKGLRPVPDAAHVDLVRRVWFQLTGLPPNQNDILEFLSDDRPDAFERVVDRLLASPHFGEWWGRHWLDLARYADSNGLDENFLFREAWRYRNWVFSAVNSGQPLDRFVLEQVAGDLLPFESVDQRDRQRIAAGFLVIGPKVLLGNNPQNQRMEVADELIDTIGRTVLGQTLGCARCHDHKFDPVPTADYYALAGIFASTHVMETRYMLGQQRPMERLAGLGTNGENADDAYELYWRQQPQVAEKKSQAEKVLEAIKQGKTEELTALVAANAAAIAEGARATDDPGRTLDQRIAAQMAFIAEIAMTLANPPPIPPRGMIPTDIDQPADEHIRVAGQFDKLGERVPRGFLTVLCDDPRIDIPEKQSGRIALGEWLMDSKHRTGQVAARVLSNRVWHHLTGSGIVRTVDNFGRTGEPPSHPELLDHLAHKLIDSEWSLKSLVREIVSSRTFALSSNYDADNYAIDPDNRSCWRANRRRLDAESTRDAILQASDQLDLAPMDSSVWYLGDQATAVGPNTVRRRTDFRCRSVYLPVIRNDLPDLFEAFDFANPQCATGSRPNTTAPGQALFMLNDDMVMDASDATARRILADTASVSLDTTDVRIERMFQLILNGAANDDLRQSMRRFLLQTEERLKSESNPQPEHRALAIACHALFASSRFQYLE